MVRSIPLARVMPNEQSLTPQALRLLSKEVVSLRNDPPEGVRIVVDEEDLTAMEGWVQGPGTCFDLSMFLGLGVYVTRHWVFDARAMIMSKAKGGDWK